MDYKRIFLFSLLMLISFNLYQAWLHDYPVQVKEKNALHVGLSDAVTQAPVSDFHAQHTATQAAPYANNKQGNEHLSSLVHVKTDVLQLAIDPMDGNIVSAKLLEYAQSNEQKGKPFVLLKNGTRKYVANSSLFIKTPAGVKNQLIHFLPEKKSYVLGNDSSELTVALKGTTETGLEVTKLFTFKRGSYLVNIDYRLQNASEEVWEGQLNTQLMQKNPIQDTSSFFHVGSYTGAAMSEPGNKLYKKVSFSDIKEDDLDRKVKNGWVAMQQHYFLTAWIPSKNSTNHFYTRYLDQQYLIGFVSALMQVAPGQSKTVSAELYVGPEKMAVLKDIAPGLELTIDYGILSVISIFLFTVMSYVHAVIGNWGWSIVIVTLLIKLAFFQLSAKSYRSMANMRRLQPKITALRDRYGDDKAKLSQATMELYRKEKVNPLGGCLPILIQIPVFIALYWVLLESVELRQAPWIFWIKDLSEADPFYILPIIMGLTMVIQQKLSPASPDPAQAKMMMMLPLVFTFLFAHFPAGLVLYWTVNNTLSILQQWYITRKYGGETVNSSINKKLVTTSK